MRTYTLSQDARDDLREIWRYTADTWGLDQADDYLHGIHERLDRLSERPSRVLSGMSRPVRFLKHQSHVIYFEQHDTDALIIAILHERMNLLARLKDRL